MNATRIKFTAKEKVAYALRAKKIENPMPFEERQRLVDMADEAEEHGELEKASVYRRKLPMYWGAALIWIEQYGRESLHATGRNLDWAVAVLGRDVVYG